MVANLKQASNDTGLSLAREISPSVVDNTVTWLAQEPNSYKDFGGTVKTVARNPINSSRQNKKGVVVDLDAKGGWQEDITFESMQNKIEGVMFADFRRKAEVAATAAETSDDKYTVASIVGFASGDIISVSGMTNPANNGVKHINAAPASGQLAVAENLADESGSTGKIVRVGHVGASGDLVYTAASKTLVSTALDFTTLGLIPGEWVFASDDTPADDLGANLGFARVLTVAAHSLVFDKVYPARSGSPITDAPGTGKTARLYFGRVIKNELAALIKRYTYQAERTLGRDDSTATEDQAEYITGCVLDEMTLTFNTADKGTVDWTLVGARYETNTSTEGPKAGNRPVLVESSAFNTSTDMPLIDMSLVGSSVPLYAYLIDFAVTIKNNAKANKALGVLGAIDITEGQFDVSASATAYFANVDAANAIQGNSNVGVTACIARDNHGILCDLPLVTLGNGLNKVAANEVIQLPLDVNAATASLINPNTDYTLMFVFFDYLPTLIAG